MKEFRAIATRYDKTDKSYAEELRAIHRFTMTVEAR